MRHHAVGRGALSAVDGLDPARPDVAIGEAAQVERLGGAVGHGDHHAGVLPKGFQNAYSDLGKSPSSVGRDLRTWSPEAERANTVAHEGEHGADMRDGRPMSEPNAYATGRAASRSMGTAPFSELPSDDDR